MSIWDVINRRGERPDGLVVQDEEDRLKPYNGYFASDMWQSVINGARRQGFSVELSSNGYMHMSRGASYASFTDIGDCIDAVQEFLRGEA